MLKMYEVPAAIDATYNEETEEYDLTLLKQVKMETEEKAVSYIAVIKNLAGEEAAIEAEINRLKARLDARKRNKENLIAALKFGMEALGIPKISNGPHQAKIVNNSAPSVEITNEDAVPVEFKKEIHEVKIDKRAIADHIRQTGEIPEGVEAKRGTHLRIS